MCDCLDCSDWCGIVCAYCCNDCQFIDKRTTEDIIKSMLPKKRVPKPREDHHPDPEEVFYPGIPEHESVYELTLTTTKDDPYELRAFLKKVCKSKMFNIVYWKACIELTKNGMPHIHAILYSSNKYCDSTKIKALKYPYRYEFLKVRDEDAYNKYIIKEKNNVEVSMYCERKGIQQIWDGQSEEDIQPPPPAY